MDLSDVFNDEALGYLACVLPAGMFMFLFLFGERAFLSSRRDKLSSHH